MKKKIISLILALTLCLPVLPFGAIASAAVLCEHHTEHIDCGYVEGETPCGYSCTECVAPVQLSGEQPDESVCICETKCGDTINAECEVCAADLAVCEGENAALSAVVAVQALIAALPDAETLAAMSTEEQNEVYDALLAADEAYQALNEEQKGQLAEENAKLDVLFDWFSNPNMAAAAINVKYIGANGETKICDMATDVTADDSTWYAGWYYVAGTLTINRRVTVVGDVHLILTDNAVLTVSGGIGVGEGDSFTIYAQSTSKDTMGKLTATGGTSQAGIGGTNSAATANSGAITINGGVVEATGGESSAGIGGGRAGTGSNGSNITINGGDVTANGGNSTTYGGAGIGGGYGGYGSNININGGVVKATGGSANRAESGGAGIGGGARYDGSNITITGGVVEASSSYGGAGIGGGSAGDGSNITITGGVVKASSSSGGAGIGGGSSSTYAGDGSNIIISSGNVTASSEYGAGIGGGNGTDGNANVEITGGVVKASSEYGSAGIGGGRSSAGGNGNVKITGGDVTATCSGFGVGIGGGYSDNSSSVGGNGNVEITGGDVTATGNTGVGIGTGTGTVTISGGDTVAKSNQEAFRTAPTVLDSFADAKTWYGDTEAAAVAAGARPATELATNYTQKYVRIAAAYGITFNTNGGTFADNSTATTLITGADGKLASLPGDPARTNHIFKGWFDAQTGGNKVNVTTDAVFGSNKTMYAQWEGIASISITTQLLNTSVIEGSISGKLSVTASVSPGGIPTYQWYSCTSADKSGAQAVPGATHPTFTIPTDLTQGTYYYFCRISADGAEDVDSNAVTVTVGGAAQPTLTPTSSGNPTSTSELDDLPDTGDDSQTGLWIGLMMTALAGLAVCAVLWRRKRTE